MNEQETNQAAANAAIDANNAWHRSNLEYLRVEIDYLKQRNIVAALHASREFAKEEQKRKDLREKIFQKHDLTYIASPYQDEEKLLNKRSKALVQRLLNETKKKIDTVEASA